MGAKEHQEQIFNNLMVRVAPAAIASCRPLIKISLACAVTGTMETYPMQRINFLTVCLETIQPTVSPILFRSAIFSWKDISYVVFPTKQQIMPGAHGPNQDPEMNVDVISRVASVLCNRLEKCYMELSEKMPNDPVLQRIPPLTRKARDLASASRVCLDTPNQTPPPTANPAGVIGGERRVSGAQSGVGGERQPSGTHFDLRFGAPGDRRRSGAHRRM